MYFYVDTAIKARKCHHLGNSAFEKRVIRPGDKHLRMSNGTIGRGCIELNWNRYDSIRLLKEMLKELETGPRVVKPKVRAYPSDYGPNEIPF